MAKATITLEDQDQTGEVLINVDFDPPVTEESEASHALSMALQAVQHLQATYGQGTKAPESAEPSDATQH